MLNLFKKTEIFNYVLISMTYLLIHNMYLAPLQNKFFNLGEYFYGAIFWVINFIFMVLVLIHSKTIYKQVVFYKYKEYMKTPKYIDEISEIFNMQGFNLNTLRILTSSAIEVSYNTKVDKWGEIWLSFVGSIVFGLYTPDTIFYIAQFIIGCVLLGIVVYLGHKKAHYRFILSQLKIKRREMLNEQ